MLLTSLHKCWTASYSSAAPGSHLTHIDKQGRPSMIDVSEKETTRRTAIAQGRIFIPEVAFNLIRDPDRASQDGISNGDLKRRRDRSKAKGDVLTVSQLAGIMASKKTSDLIPLCHTIPLSHASVELLVEDHSSGRSVDHDRQYSVLCRATVTCDGKTGVEMEALTAVSVSLLTVWDMLKAVAGKEMVIEGLCVINKVGGKSGDFERNVD